MLASDVFEKVVKFYQIDLKRIETIRNEECLLAKIEDKNNVIYYLKGEKVEQDYWEACCQFAHALYQNGFHVPIYKKSSFNTFTIQEGEYVWRESNR